MISPKQRMLNAYRGIPSDRPPVAPEFWVYYPAKLMGVDMIEFGKIPFQQVLKSTFQRFGCEGWGVTSGEIPNPHVRKHGTEKWIDAETLEARTTFTTPRGELTDASRCTRQEPGWVVERFVKDLKRDLPAWEWLVFGGSPEDLQVTSLINEWNEAGETFLLEANLGVPFFDFFAGSREGGFETAIHDFADPELTSYLEKLRSRYQERLVRLAQVVCEKTPMESLFIGCSWSCNSLIGPKMWRQWDQPVIQVVANEVHRHGKLLHVHFHGRSLATVSDFAEMGIDCVCPFERPPGGDIAGLEGLKKVARQLNGRTCMNGNIHTVETLIRGQPEDVRHEVREVLEAFQGNPRVIVGTGDQVGRETPEENLLTMIEEVKKRFTK